MVGIGDGSSFAGSGVFGALTGRKNALSHLMIVGRDKYRITM
jgi:hypothetical protein